MKGTNVLKCGSKDESLVAKNISKTGRIGYNPGYDLGG